jgi:hypothetical protein
MQPNEALGVAAQVAVTLAGFAGIVAVFRPQSLHQWSVLDRLRLILLLMNSAAPLVFALFGMLLLCIDPVPVSIWRWCSGFAFVTDVLVFVYMRNNPKGRLSLNEMQMTSKFVLYAVSVMSMTGVALQVVNFAVWNRFWPFFVTIFVHLTAAIIQFLRMLLIAPAGNVIRNDEIRMTRNAGEGAAGLSKPEGMTDDESDQ